MPSFWVFVVVALGLVGIVPIIEFFAKLLSKRLRNRWRWLASVDTPYVPEDQAGRVLRVTPEVDPPVLVYGAGRLGIELLRNNEGNPGIQTYGDEMFDLLKPVGFLDDADNKQGTTVNGFPVYGRLEELPDVLEVLKAEGKVVRGLVIAIARPTEDRISLAKRLCRQTGLKCYRFGLGIGIVK